jgi:bifunctional DNA-binding transcriptional regulator/antitoxin component of YhaV-PrlF toxin-antitoxin module
MWAKVDERGRVYIPKPLRKRISKEVFAVEVKGGILLVPKPQDPVKELEEIGRRLPEKSVKEFRREIENTAVEEIE